MAKRMSRSMKRAMKVRGGFAPLAPLKAPRKFLAPRTKVSTKKPPMKNISDKAAKKELEPRTHVQRGAERVTMKKTNTSKDTEKDQVIREKRSVKTDKRTDRPPTIGFTLGPGKRPEPATGAALYTKDAMLPIGSILTSEVKLGSSAAPPSSVAQRQTMRVYQASGQFGSDTLQKAPSHQQRTVGINQCMSLLIPAALPAAFERRMAVMKYPSYGGSVGGNDTAYQMFDNTAKSQTSTSTFAATTGTERSTYMPFNILSDLQITSLNESLGCTVDIKCVQLNRDIPNSYAIEKSVLEPKRILDACFNTMPTNYRVAAPSAQQGKATNSQQIYGEISPTGDDFFTGSYQVVTMADKPIYNAPVFQDYFNVVHSARFKVGAGNSRRSIYNQFYSKCWQKQGNYATMKEDGNLNTYSREQYFYLITVQGDKVPYYKATRSGNVNTPVTSRLWDTGSCPVFFTLKQTMDYTFYAGKDWNAGTTTGGLWYRRNYLKVDRESNVSQVHDVIPSNIVSSEAEIITNASTGPVIKYIVPVSTDKHIIGAQIKTNPS
jgi:hypothetical protein